VKLKHLANFCGNLKATDNSEDLGKDGGIILILILGKWSRRVWTGFFWVTRGFDGELS
jgi:hypothetical protein